MDNAYSLTNVVDHIINPVFFKQSAFREVTEVEGKFAKLTKLKEELAVYFCEDETKFKLEEILGIFKTFCGNMAKAREVCLIL